MIQIREATYRSRRGFSITGRDTRGRPVRIFCDSREEAEEIRRLLRWGVEDACDRVWSGRVTRTGLRKEVER